MRDSVRQLILEELEDISKRKGHAIGEFNKWKRELDMIAVQENQLRRILSKAGEPDRITGSEDNGHKPLGPSEAVIRALRASSDGMPLRELIRQLTSGNRLKTKSDTPNRLLTSIVAQLRRNGRVEQDDEGNYRLTKKEEEQEDD